jgi:hypothetical protein
VNNGPTDEFMMQVLSVNPPPNMRSWPWSLRWEGTEGEFIEIIQRHQRTLYLCRVDLTGEISDPVTKHWKPARVWFFTPRENKEVFLSIDGIRKSDDLYKMRIVILLGITARLTKEQTQYQAEFRFDPGSAVPHCAGIQML